MAETKSEDDDDEAFGAFAFASFPAHHHDQAVGSNQINGHHNSSSTAAATTAAAGNGDDEWGDFVEYPLRSELPAGPSTDPFGFFSDQSVKLPQSGLARTQSAQWVKPKGALPLSIFGDAEEEESGASDDPSVGDATISFADKQAGHSSNQSNSHLGVGLNDFIANLYGQTQQIKAVNELNSDLNGTNLHTNGPALHASNGNFDVMKNLYGHNDEIKAENGVIANSRHRLTDSGELNVKSASILKKEGFDGDAEDDGWEFRDASMVGDGNHRGAVASEIMGLEPQPRSISIKGQEMQVVPKLQEFFEVTTYSSGYSNGSHAPFDLFAASNGNSSETHEMDSRFNFKAGRTAYDSFASDSNLQQEQNGIAKGFNSHPPGENADSDELFGEFGAAVSEPGPKQEVDPKFPEFVDSTTGSSGFSNGSHVPFDLFAEPNGITGESHVMDSRFEFKPNALDASLQHEQNETGNGLNSHSLVESADSDETFGEFEAAFTESVSKQQENETRSEIYKGAMPLSIFGSEELEIDGSLDNKDVFMFKTASYPRNVQNQGTNLSVNDLLSDLYSQAELNPRVDSVIKPPENGCNSINEVSNTKVMGGDEDFDDSSWEYKDAVSPTQAKDQTSLPRFGEGHQNSFAKQKLLSYVDFYRKLLEELCFVARCHVDSLKKAQSTAAPSGEDGDIAALDEQLQEACKFLHQENLVSEEAHTDQRTRRLHLNEFLEVLDEHNFLVLESEYHLSRRISTAEEDPRSTIELIKHAKIMLKIVLLVSSDEQFSYISTWLNMISACAQELRHGAWIWKQSLEKDVQTEILSEPRGKRFILALGEIYRVVVVLEASVKLFKLWILLSTVDATVIYALLEECHTLWSSSGLQDALSSLSNSTTSGYDGNVKALLESIKHIHDFDAFTPGNHDFAQVPLCRLSILTPGNLPGTKLVAWNGENYILTLANVWANLISPDPPNLPSLHVS